MMPEGFKTISRKEIFSTYEFQNRIKMMIKKRKKQDEIEKFEVSLSPEAIEVIWEYGDMVTLATTSWGELAIIPGADCNAENARVLDISIPNEEGFLRWTDPVVRAYLRQHQSFKGEDGKFWIYGLWDEKNRCLRFDLNNRRIRKEVI